MMEMVLLQLFVTSNADEYQRQAIINVYTGQAKGNAPFALFAGTFKYFLEPKFVDLQVNLNGKKSRFSVPGVMDVQTESFANPVTGEEQDTKIQLPKGLVWRLAEAAKSKIMRITTQSLNFDHSGQNAFYAVVEYEGP